MSKDLKKYFDRVGQISSVAASVKAACVDSQLDGGAVISNNADWASSVTDAALKQPMFEALGSKAAVAHVASSWGSAISDYCDQHGSMPRDEVLASCGETLASIVGMGDGSITKMMMESLGGSESLATSKGVEIRAKTAALILPVALSAATNDAATFVAGGRDEVEIFEIERIAGADFGDVSKGELIDDFFDKQYSGLKQAYALPTQQDGTKTDFALYIYNETSPLVDAEAIVDAIPNHNPQGIGYRQKSLRLFLNGRQVASDLASGQLFGSFVYQGTTYNVTPNNHNDYDRGIIGFKVSPALPVAAGTLAIQFDVNVEGNAGVLPEVQHKMSSFKLNPHQSVIAAQHTIMAYWAMSREYGVDLPSLQSGVQRNLLAYEKDRRNLRDMLLATAATATTLVDLTVAQGTYFKEKYEELHEALLQLSQQMLVETKTSGLVGLYAGSGAATLVKALGAPYFVPAPNYRQVPRVHYCGLLFGKYKIFEVPVNFSHAGLTFGAMDLIGYARGTDYSQAGLIVGDAVPATMYQHGVHATLFKRDTLWESAYGDISPRDGYKYFRKITITK